MGLVTEYFHKAYVFDYRLHIVKQIMCIIKAVIKGIAYSCSIQTHIGLKHIFLEMECF